MDIEDIKKEIHKYVDIADEHFLRLVHRLVENEQIKEAANAFSSTTDEVVKKAKETLSTVKEGLSKNLQEFEEKFESWKKQQSNKSESQ